MLAVVARSAGPRFRISRWVPIWSGSGGAASDLGDRADTPDSTYSNVWDAIKDTPEDAENMKFRSQLMITITGTIRANGWTQKVAAEHLHFTQDRICDLMRGRIHQFSRDTLVEMATAVGLHVD